MKKTIHKTLVFERAVPAPTNKVFEAFSDPAARADWGAPSQTAVVIYDAADFREGGVDRFRCGSRENPNIHGLTQYLDILPGQRIVSTETITVEGNRLCASLTTLELVPDGESTLIKNTTQLASFIGEEMVNGYTIGTNASLDKLVEHFKSKG